jgi:hypothetical protein
MKGQHWQQPPIKIGTEKTTSLFSLSSFAIVMAKKSGRYSGRQKTPPATSYLSLLVVGLKLPAQTARKPEAPARNCVSWWNPGRRLLNLPPPSLKSVNHMAPALPQTIYACVPGRANWKSDDTRDEIWQIWVLWPFLFWSEDPRLAQHSRLWGSTGPLWPSLQWAQLWGKQRDWKWKLEWNVDLTDSILWTYIKVDGAATTMLQ